MEVYILDATAILEGLLPEGKKITSPGVAEEVRNKGCSYVLSIIDIETPEKEYIEKVVNAARKTGDIEKLSKADIEILALALKYGGILVSDDYAVQNVAQYLGIKYMGMKKIREERKYCKVCTKCGRYWSIKYEKCPVCGGELKLCVKKKKSL